MDTDRLRYFCTVARTGNLHRASELLRLTPAALSKSIKALESELGIKLMTPAGRGVAITQAGKKFAVRAASLLENFDALIRTTAHPESASQGILKVGSFEVFTTHSLPVWLGDLLPEFQVVVHELTPGLMEEALVEGRIDFAITYIPIPSPDLDFLPVTQLQMGMYHRRGLFRGKSLSEIPFAVPVTPISGSPTKVAGLDGWPDHEVKRNIKYRVTMMETALELCRMGLAAAYLPSFVAKLHNEKVRDEYFLQESPNKLPLKMKHVKQPVYLVKRKADPESDWMKKVAKGLRILCRT